MNSRSAAEFRHGSRKCTAPTIDPVIYFHNHPMELELSGNVLLNRSGCENLQVRWLELGILRDLEFVRRPKLGYITDQ